MLTRADLAADLRRLGLEPGDAVMVHAGMQAVGEVLGGPDTLIGAIRDTVGPRGTVLTDVRGRPEWAPSEQRNQVPGFDVRSSRADFTYGVFAEFLRTTPGAHRSASPRASVAALGSDAEWFTADHPLDYAYGPGSPYAKLVERGGKVAMIGAPYDYMSIMVHAEFLPDVPQDVYGFEVPFATADGTVWCELTDIDPDVPVLQLFEGHLRGCLVGFYVEAGGGRTGTVGRAHALVADAADLVASAVAWIEEHQHDEPQPYP